MDIELDHTVSQTASNAMWKLAFEFIPKILESRNIHNIRRKIPQFNHIRRKLHKKYTPPVHLEMAYKKRDSDEITIVNDSVTPRTRFPGNVFEKLYEVATVKVNQLTFCYKNFALCFNLFSLNINISLVLC